MTDERIVSSQKRDGDALDASIRPQSLDDFIGQEQARANLRVFIQAARSRGDALDQGISAGLRDVVVRQLPAIEAARDEILALSKSTD